jgi:hypothetical protein
MRQYSIDQCAMLMPDRRVDNHTGWLIDHQNMIVFVKDVQRRGFWLNVNGLGRRDGGFDMIAALDGLTTLVSQAAINQYKTFLDQVQPPCPREFWEMSQQDFIQALRRGFCVCEGDFPFTHRAALLKRLLLAVLPE